MSNAQSWTMLAFLGVLVSGLLASVTSQGHALRASIADLRESMNARFSALELTTTVRFDGVDRRLDGLDNRLDRVEGRLDSVEGRLDGVERKLGDLDRDVQVLTNEIFPGRG